MKLLLWVVIVFFIVMWYLHMKKSAAAGRRRDSSAGAAGTAAGSAAAPAVAPPEPMVRCVECGLHVPASEAIRVAGPGDDGRVDGPAFCSLEHRLRHRG
ncbi:MAG: hypothetical protein JWP36_643 [Paucimonas sp.]|nr:hypothetical protein [Paucimonas sp.]